MIRFKHAAHIVRTFDREQKDVDIVQSILESLMGVINGMKEEQEEAFKKMKKIYSLIANSDSNSSVSPFAGKPTPGQLDEEAYQDKIEEEILTQIEKVNSEIRRLSAQQSEHLGGSRRSTDRGAGLKLSEEKSPVTIRQSRASLESDPIFNLK
mmetsp:Transcript_8536/g.13173  ORF Transcript_8536/g.13173 Transcript_8536/m.13173 type:complete len:153 (+) Transcript_8536:1604-2062(+)